MIIILIRFILRYCINTEGFLNETNMGVEWKYFQDHKSYIVMDNPGSNLVVLIKRHGDFPYFTHCFIPCACVHGTVFGDIAAIEINNNLINSCIISTYPSIIKNIKCIYRILALLPPNDYSTSPYKNKNSNCF